MSDTQTPIVYSGSRIERVTIEVEAEVNSKGHVFLLLPKTRFKMHRESIDRYMILDTQQQKAKSNE